MDDLISRQAAIDALWKALYEYEDKTEKQFIESDELDVEDWVQHRIFVQNMNDIDRQTILEIPSAQQWVPCSERVPEEDGRYLCTYSDFATCVDFGLYADGQWIIEPIAWMPLPGAYVVHGEWVKDEEQSKGHIETIYTCSACHNFSAWGETEKYNYCPNCGADMRGEK